MPASGARLGITVLLIPNSKLLFLLTLGTFERHRRPPRYVLRAIGSLSAIAFIPAPTSIMSGFDSLFPFRRGEIFSDGAFSADHFQYAFDLLMFGGFNRFGGCPVQFVFVTLDLSRLKG